MTKLNCWEFMKCGRGVGGKNTKEFGVCPVVLEVKASGIHGGQTGGRCCWAIAGTFCGGEVQGTFVEKFKNCKDCPFYLIVSQEEDQYFTAVEILKKIKK
ncbi:MAG: hypothetical protein COV71_02165 [Candidatus Omnitrophica bacterium CG11_big_fil_rev_8_21_14_0_20_41_12]|nr:MAG: hypothetical protein COV71_02165 [Candidatus Omnitrophica bacterium CG11_big_fil_rev_8_21_14_0_20_41_12]